MSAGQLLQGYERAYDRFYQWDAIVKASLSHGSVKHQLKHFFYTAGWKKFEPFWNMIIQLRRLNIMTPVLEAVLSKVSNQRNNSKGRDDVCSRALF